GHAVGWPLVRGGSQQLSAALASYLRSLGGEFVTDTLVADLAELPPARVVLLDLTPTQLARVGGAYWPTDYRRQLARYRPGLGTFKVDWALDGPIPWLAPECARTATVHLGGTLDELVAARRVETRGQPAERPFVILVQPTLFDLSRAPSGKQIAWGYCHVPLNSTADM